jgi:hypothetical protein
MALYVRPFTDEERTTLARVAHSQTAATRDVERARHLARRPGPAGPRDRRGISPERQHRRPLAETLQYGPVGWAHRCVPLRVPGDVHAGAGGEGHRDGSDPPAPTQPTLWQLDT